MPRVGSRGALAQPSAEPQADEQPTRSLLVSGVNSNHSEDELKQLFSVRPLACAALWLRSERWPEPMSPRRWCCEAGFWGTLLAA